MKASLELDNILARLQRLAEAKHKNNPDYRIDRSAFLYMEPKGEVENFAQCASCWKFTGQTCLEFSKDNKVVPGGTCGLYCNGTPREDLAGSESGGTTPEVADYVERPVRCENCVSFDSEKSVCMRFKDLSESKPEFYDLDFKVKAKACCNANVSKD